MVRTSVALRWALVLLLALGTAACLPASVRPTPTPGPTPTPQPVTPPAPTPTPGPPTPTPGPTFMLYTVAKGDTLTSIARRFHTSGRSIAYWNRDQYPSLDPESPKYSPDSIQRGWVLRVIPNQEYVPQPSDYETGESPTPGPDDGLESDSPDPAGSADPAASPAG